MKTFHLFGFYDDQVEYSGSGGMNDYIGSFNTLEDAQKHFAEHNVYTVEDVYHKVDRHIYWTDGQIAIVQDDGLKIIALIEIKTVYEDSNEDNTFNELTGRLNCKWSAID